ncbi:translation initiation factor IF-2 [Fusibacter bizertensis]|jgi:translation initiation factor IF-2|uniref:Translation initiation factor IF-2 n=1 Tax=Fusibacter bizertensis TaxID=1488331 RepID=A0ABT6N837_9FIRM|nr:translation initiation factor IF-2 [Fusibacter bizertensis]MDH8676585.1 translation initiation factor IF-2 [Fusibacter bizertensis]
MSKTRIHELAKEINVSTKDLIDSAHQLGYEVKNHMSTLEDQEIKQLKGRFMKKASEGTESKTDKVNETKETKPVTSGSTPATDATTGEPKPEKHHKIIYDRTKEIKEEENRRSQSRPYDNRNKNYNNNRTNQGTNQSSSEQSTTQGQGTTDNRGERKPYNNNYQKQGYASKPYERKPYDPNRPARPQGENSQGTQGEGQQRPYNRSNNSYDNRSGDRKPYEKKPYDPNKPAYEKKPYDPNKPYEKKPYEKRPYDPNKPAYEKRPYDPNKPYEKRPYDPNKPAYEKRPYDPNKPAYERKPRPVGPDGKPIYNNEGGYKGNRPSGQGGYNRSGSGSSGGSRPYGSGGGSSQGKKLDNTMKSAFSTSDIQEKTPKKKKQKKDKIVVTFDTDKLENKSKKAKKLLKEEIIVNEVDPRREFDFGKKVKQKSGKYKEKTEKEKSEKLDEILAKEVVLVPAEMTIKTFAETINKPATDVIMKLMAMGNMASLNKLIDYDTAATVALEYDILLEAEVVEVENQFEIFDLDTPDNPEDLVKRAPVVTVMGHVDHGKTSLLDAIRNTGVASGEAGGITQHIGASEVVHNGEKIVFLDTPGHEAFTSLRARGAKVTDIAILVVAADDGVMPQTIEAIDHSKAANVPIIVAINKIDKPNANPDRVKQELSDRGVVIEEWGGDVIAVPVSAKTGEGLDKLLEMVLLVSEVLELKANPKRPGVGTVIEAKVVKGRGTATTIILEKGTLNVGDPVVAGTTFGKIKAMYNDKGKKVKHIGPSTTVEIDGLSDIPQAGEKIYVTPDDKTARVIADRHAIAFREKSLNKNPGVTLEDIFSRIKEGGMKELNIIIKADVQGSVEAIKQSLLKLTNEEVRVNIIRADVGAISESDVILASASSAIIIGFNVRPSAIVTSTADQEGVDIRTYQIIYNAINDVETAMKGMLDPLYKEVILGRIQVRATFKIPGGVIAGGYVTTGKVTRNAQVRVIREGIVINEGKISSLKRFKDDVKEVATGYECGIGIEKFNDLKENDEIEAFIMEEVKR